jgi:hypothetical protein
MSILVTSPKLGSPESSPVGGQETVAELSPIHRVLMFFGGRVLLSKASFMLLAPSSIVKLSSYGIAPRSQPSSVNLLIHIHDTCYF